MTRDQRDQLITAGLFVLGMIGVGLSNGRYATTVGPWVALPLLLVFLDRAGPWRGLVWLVPAHVLVHIVSWRGIIPAPGWIYIAVAAAYGLCFAIPFVVDAVAGARDRRPFAGTLVFPAAWVALELALARLTPYGSWGAIAYTQIEVLPLTQLASAVGTAGVAFLIAWTGAIVAWVVARRGAALPVPRAGWVAWVVVLLAAVVYGELRLGRSPGPAEHVRVALLAPSPALRGAFDQEFRASFQSGDAADAGAARLRTTSEAVIADLVARTRREARAGAAIVAWAETAAKVFGTDADAFTERMGRLAAEERIHLVVGLGVWTADATPPLRNALLAFEPDGRLAWTFDKAHPIIGGEASLVDAGDGILPAWDTPYGRLTAAICHDFDFAPLLHQAGDMRAVVALAPSDDWRTIAWLHADMARVRAVEQGLTLLRPAYGVSLVASPEGRVLAAGNTFDGAGTVVATVPLRRVRTVYAMLGDAFAWLCLIGLLVLIPLVRRPRHAVGPDRDAAVTSRGS
ncbi:MAG: hypothetical protein OER21_15870, partial [Gemmatimonadota bacterium]|nr:hypothetical protein [Gemmatimonadota bacterium]